MFSVFKKYIAAWATFWLGVVIALIVLATSGWQPALIVFAVALLISIVLLVLAAKRAYNEVMSFGVNPSQPGRPGNPFGF
jgi:uncharacterized membrane protein YdbT with pleckstrin-like domain